MAPRWPQKGPKRVTKLYTRSGNTTHDTRHTTHRAQQAARFLERRARGGPRTTPTTTRDSTHTTRTMGGAVLGMTGATKPNNHTPKHCTRRTTHHTHYGPWDSNAGPKLWEERCAGVTRWKSDLLNHERLQPQRLVHYYSLLSFFPPSPCTGSAASIYTYGSLCNHSMLWVSGSKWPGGDAQSAENFRSVISRILRFF